MAEFDPELYLRLLAERFLSDPGDRNQMWSVPFVDAADALVAAGVIEDDLGQRVVDDYVDALAARNADGHWGRGRSRRPRPAPSPLTPQRVVSASLDVGYPGGTLQVRSVRLSEQRTTLAIRFVFVAPRGRRRGISRMQTGLVQPPNVQLADDRGNVTSASFGGGGSDTEWDGRYEANTPLARDTAWIEIDGHRLELPDPPRAHEVELEPVPEANPALRFLAFKLATPFHGHFQGGTLNVAIDALSAAGVLDRDDPTVGMQEVLQSFSHQAAPRSRTGLGDPWSSLLARRQFAKGPLGTIDIGAVTPVFDGLSVGVSTLESNREGFELDVEASPPPHRGFMGNFTVGGPALAWWAADDRGNHYLGTQVGWSGSEDHGTGTVTFTPGLDPEATRLDILPTGLSNRCAIRIPLAWNRSAEEEDEPAP